ncbi:3-oxoacyl-[acyl-carrier-protein] reductase FabG-like [Pectinophora gossypiella]|uniref:3-oxoacyl-[acyl-carrier-protein] reductase FabG-like n=1 Tax=Pectinophora gossypiella TaxID=13191 RepID=UPI00214EB606|nr:3-oxoacyl-[acyl-carrier-protein] reductase FabG-like [Pectinophora gossypiella]
MASKPATMDFEGKVVLVTGASAGIGEAIALLFARRGAKLALVGRNESALRAVAERCRASGRDALPLVADLATDAGCENVAKLTLEHFGRLDVLVNNAGVGARTTLEKTDMEIFDQVFALNVRAVYNLTRLLAPALVATRGNVVNISSIAGSTTYVGCLPYSMSKAALDHFTNLTALELAPKGVRVNTVSPGLTASTFVQRLTGYTDEEYAAWLQQSERGIPLGRACAGHDVAAMVAHLASDASALVTGVNVPVDGGLRFNVVATDLVKKQVK